jgi:hypothetical protein
MLFSRVENVFCVLDRVETWGALYGRFRVPKSRMIVLRRRISTQSSGRSSCFSIFVPARVLYLLSAGEHLNWQTGVQGGLHVELSLIESTSVAHFPHA